ncbi:hypothetical protein F2Q65_18835 [Thiohalocapsa marina]|uniref:DUF3558 domain-containing protein n=1 Tax=Thiohalocapsa marina TaxID=424902 RepID=A0A5M8FAH5_9GAMM|nr:hypothetical protein [Thiohalocapsa marina]KAA6181833.1 hypothetical protein F2Q65_18835 [Thiohalocapsa marina]
MELDAAMRTQVRDGRHTWGRWWRAPILILGASVLSAGCGSDDGGTQAVAKLDACAVLTAQDVGAVLGANAVETEAGQHGDGDFWASSCRYQVVGADAMLAASLMLRPHHSAAGAAQAYADYDNDLATQLGEGARLSPVAGLGEKAGWQAFGTAIGQLTVFQGPYQLIITASETADRDQLDNGRALAQRALARLPSQ